MTPDALYKEVLSIVNTCPGAEKREAERHWTADIPNAPTESTREEHGELIVKAFYHSRELVLSHVRR